MNKILLTSICAATLTSGVSAFTLDFSSLTSHGVGTHVLTQEGATFTISEGSKPAGETFAGQFTGTNPGTLTINDNSTVIVDYDETKISYTGVDIALDSSAIINDTGSFLLISTGSARGLNFEPTSAPEPSSTALLGLGSLALILRRRK